jgi:hypothetical protein
MALGVEKYEGPMKNSRVVTILGMILVALCEWMRKADFAFTAGMRYIALQKRGIRDFPSGRAPACC